MNLQNPRLLQSGAFINNSWITGDSEFAVLDPATAQEVIKVNDCGESECLKAIKAASTAFETWGKTTARERSAILRKWFDLVIQNTSDLALLLTTEQGKPLAEAKGEIQYGASFIDWNAEECRRTYGEMIPTPVTGKRLMTIKQPIGVVAAITPWNFPVAMITRKIAPAIAAGCTVILKPAEDTPLCALALAQLAMEAGLPAGVLNVLPTSKASVIGKILTSHPVIKKLSFTGSTEVGKLLMEQCASTVKRLSLELGGNAPVIIFDDADLKVAVAGTLASKYRNAGQTCVCANRIFVQKRIYPSFIEQYKTAVAMLRVGNGANEEVQIGPLINEEGINKVKRLLFDATEKGAEILIGGKPYAAGDLFFEPTIITNCTTEMRLSKEEVFGPVSSIFLFDTEEEVIKLANDTEYGLAAYFFSENLNRAWRVAEQLEYGMIGINEGIISHAEAPFGGIKESGFGKEGSFYGIEEYLETKYLCMGNL